MVQGMGRDFYLYFVQAGKNVWKDFINILNLVTFNKYKSVITQEAHTHQNEVYI